MERIQQLNYEKDFRIAFLESKGDGFQLLFEKVMSKAYPNDFMACRPWGKSGDKKNDGYLPSKRTLYQVYAPNDMKAVSAVKKIKEDFNGAKEHWVAFFDTWSFVHNTPDGRLAPHIIEELETLRKNNPEIVISTCGYEELLKEFRRLTLEDLQSWFGLSLTSEVSINLGYEDLKLVLKHIEVSSTPSISKVKEVSRGKLEANLLSTAVADFLKIGMKKAPLVADFFENWNDPIYGEKIAATFKAKYLELKKVKPELHPDEIFGQLEDWAGGSYKKTAMHKAAVLAVLAYLFDRCEIFEDARNVRII